MIAERHQRLVENFAAVAAGVTDWQAATPVPQWRAEQIVDHLVSWSTDFLQAGGIDLGTDLSVDHPGDRWDRHRHSVQVLLDSPRAREDFTHPMLGTAAVGTTLDRIYTTDVLMHTWDLARSAGVDHGLDGGECEEILAGMRGIEDLLRSSGQYGPAVAVDDSAPAADRLMAFVGRDPQWSASRT